MKKRKPTRRDLLVVIGRIQGLIGSISGTAHDRNPNRAAQLDSLCRYGVKLAIDARSYDNDAATGPWAEQNGEDSEWMKAS